LAGPIKTLQLWIYYRCVCRDITYIKRLLDKTDEVDKNGNFDMTGRGMKLNSGKQVENEWGGINAR
jgi:hypothetical protein